MKKFNSLLPNIGKIPRWTVVILIIAVLGIVISGCMGGASTEPLGQQRLTALGQQMVEIEGLTTEQLDERERELLGEARGTEEKEEQARYHFLRGYVAEVRETRTTEAVNERDYSDAYARYNQSMKLGGRYAAQASYRIGVLGAQGLLGLGDETESLNEAKRALRGLTTGYGESQVLVRNPEFAGAGGQASLLEAAAQAEPVLYPMEMSAAAMQKLDLIYRTGGGLDGIYYRAVDAFVSAFEAITPAYGAALALIVLALLVKLVTLPLSTWAFRGMREMQRIQPLLQELQKKYKDDRQKLAEEQMKLMQEHKVSPLGGCLPMLIQLPIFIVVYQAVLVYGAEFAQARFFWISSLAHPDWVLLILYAVSMFVTQKLTTMPATDPQQQMIQKQMTFMMPVVLLFILSNFASAFVLYWFFLNIFSSAHQYYLMRRFNREEAATATPAVIEAEAPSSNRKKGRRR